MLAMATIQLSRELSNNTQAVRKRHYRTVLKEKKRRSFFVHEYVCTKYPNIYTEANSMYQTLVDKYPEKVDFTKLYYFKKWQKKMDQSTSQLYVPHLPILRKDLCMASEEPPTTTTTRRTRTARTPTTRRTRAARIRTARTPTTRRTRAARIRTARRPATILPSTTK